jgi:hypothetical protein
LFTLLHPAVQRGLERAAGQVFFGLPILRGEAVLCKQSKLAPLSLTGTEVPHIHSALPEASIHTGPDNNNLSHGLGSLLNFEGYTVKRVDEVVRHPHLVTQDQFTQVSKKVSDIPEENFTINIEPFRHFSQVSNLFNRAGKFQKQHYRARTYALPGYNLPLYHCAKLSCQLYLQ